MPKTAHHLVDSSSIQAIRQHVSDKVRALMARHGVSDSRQQFTALMSIMEASHSQVYRKVSGRSSWLEEDLLRIAQHYGETLGQLFADEDPSAEGAQTWHAAKAQLAGVWVNAEVVLAPEPSLASALVLVNSPQGPRVEAPGASPNPVQGHVLHLRVNFGQPPKGGIAVMDDDPDLLESIVDNLLMRGHDAHGFLSKEALQASPRQFDTYILDWYSGAETTTEDLVEHLRSSHAPEANIVILTGQIQRDQVETNLARLIAQQGVMVELKPAHLDLLLAKLSLSRTHSKPR